MSVTLYVGNAECNFANANFVALMDFLAVPLADYDKQSLIGSITPKEAQAIVDRIKSMSAYDMATFTEPTYTDGIITYCGRDMQYVILRLCHIVDLCLTAISLNKEIVFS